ncbi:MAG: hypothetical protein IJI41_07835 [Anaerolineaceae bacterium]|nr:hypothetical protein [Anaerolineaceae bacterium]
MIDKVTNKIRRYPFQTGIITGVIACLLIVGFFSLFQDHGKTLSGNSEIIQQDYLRMTVNEYNRDKDSQLAGWRYEHLGNQADKTLSLLRADESISPQNLVSFAEAIGKKDKIGGVNTTENGQVPAGTPANPKKGLSGFGKVLLVLVGLIIIAAGGLYAASVIQTKKKQKRRTENNQRMEEEALNMITQEKARSVDAGKSDTLFDLDSLFPQTESDKGVKAGSPDIEDEKKDDAHDGTYEVNEDQNLTDENAQNTEETDDNEAHVSEETTKAEEPKINSEPIAEYDQTTDVENISIETQNDDVQETESVEPEYERIEPENSDTEDENSKKENYYPELEYESTDNNISQEGEKYFETDREPKKEINTAEKIPEVVSEDNPETQKNETIDPLKTENEKTDENATEKPLVEVDHENETENEDELLKMIRAGQTEPEKNDIIKENKAEPDRPETENSVPSYDRKEVVPDESIDNDLTDVSEETGNESEGDEDDVLIHYQSQYRIGNDMYDEVFSIDQGDVFRGECGIGIGETLNNTEPKAVTAFEVWLFDKDDIHTATWYLMSDFALDNDGIRQRLEQRGKCDRIRRGDLYTLETETLIVEIKILELEYGNEMEEKNSYFNNVVFDVIAKEKKQD